MKKGLVRGLAVMVCSAMLLEGQTLSALAEELPEELTEVVVEAENVELPDEEVPLVGLTEEEIPQPEIMEEVAPQSEVAEEAAAPNESDFEIQDDVLIKYKGTAADVVIPEGVDIIARDAFKGCETMYSITLPETLIEIAAYSFYGCKNLQEVVIPAKVKRVQSSAFGRCDSLKSAYIMSDTTNLQDFFSNATVYAPLGSRAHKQMNEGGKSLRYRPYPETDIEYYVSDGVLIYYAPDKTDVVIPDGVTAIDDFLFYNNGNVKSVTIPSSVTKIGNSAFRSTGITEITIPESVQTLGTFAFATCPSLTKAEILGSVSEISTYCFRGDSALKEVSLPDTVTAIGGYAFQNCTSLADISLPGGLTRIDAWAFYNCDAIKEITIPVGVTNIARGTFSDCRSLEKVYIASKDCQVDSRAFLDSNPTIYAPAGSAAQTFAQTYGYNFEAWNNGEQFTDPTIPAFNPAAATHAEKVAYVEQNVREWKNSLKTEEEREYVRYLYRTQKDEIQRQVETCLQWLGMSWEEAEAIFIRVFNE